MVRDEDFRVRPGRIRSKGGGARPRSFLAQVLHASRRAGGGSSGNPGKGKGGSPRSGPSTFGRGHSRFGRSRLFDAHRRVTVKARVVRQTMRDNRPGSLADHLAYLRRDGVTRDGEKAHLFGPGGQDADAQDFAVRCKDDRHHFRFIVSPEDAPEMADLAAQVKAPGATWLDHRLVERQPMDLTRTGFGAEVRQAMQERTRHLAERGLASFHADGSARYQRNLLATLRQQELDQVGAKLAKESGLTYERSIPGNFVTGQYVKRLNLSSGRFAMIDNGMGFQLVPWAPSLEKQHDRYVDGVARDDGGVDWRHDRKRDLGISM
ncbi:DUF3363 domain-containing protein [Komagataeibacter sp. AV436]|uniref:DUF3363 domain-containing protein n=1 Tax=Komagataeibacter melomenusus TaxID=2766578 RepID=A0ABX2AEC5_9PROT|nr:DUF3363 domain-containing protein [Komagataeibacter melomenusus]NPC66204.1 DUF3363 domain-containing protein [Komagataeibacter melomenusus]